MWGFKKDDFNCVKISLLKPSTQEYQGYRNFQTVEFTKYNSNTVINAAVSVVTKDPPQSASDSLESLFTELEQLKGLVALKKAGRGKKRTTSLWEVTETGKSNISVTHSRGRILIGDFQTLMAAESTG